MNEYSTEDKVLALIAHLGALTGVGFLLLPLGIWLLKKDSSRFVSMHAKQAMVWQGACLLGGTILATAGFFFTFMTAGLGAFLFIPGMCLLGLILLVPSVLASIAVFNEKPYSYPLTGALAERL